MEQKKQLLIRILKQLKGHWNLAQGFLIIVEKTGNKRIIDNLLKLIQTGIKSIKNKRVRTKLINKVKELQKKGDLEQEKDSEKTDYMLDNFINNIEN